MLLIGFGNVEIKGDAGMLDRVSQMPQTLAIEEFKRVQCFDGRLHLDQTAIELQLGFQELAPIPGQLALPRLHSRTVPMIKIGTGIMRASALTLASSHEVKGGAWFPVRLICPPPCPRPYSIQYRSHRPTLRDCEPR